MPINFPALKNCAYLLLTGIAVLGFSLQPKAQTHKKIIRCATSAAYEQLFLADPAFKKQFDANSKRLNSLSAALSSMQRMQQITDTIPVVIHVVGTAALQSQITDAVLQSQIDVLNEDYQGRNGDSIRIPTAFKPLFGKSRMVFTLARQNDLGEPSNGIVRVVSSASFNASNADNAKLSSAGGSNAWDPKRFMNLWVVNFGSSSVLGISVFPGDPRPLHLHGFVCDYRAFGRGASYLFPDFNKGRTTTHELGHFFGLRHIWGSDDGGCSDSDFSGTIQLDDTPNQDEATLGNPDIAGTGKVVTDNCSPNPPGIMYQNYMDYSDDIALVMFTKGQQERMELTITASEDRSPLLTSTTYQVPPAYALDTRIRNILSPESGSIICSSGFAPIVTLRNSGSATLTSVQIVAQLNGETPVVYNWTGSLAPYTETAVTLDNFNAVSGANSLTVYTQSPNGGTDENPSNDAATVTFTWAVVQPLNKSVTEEFSSSQFPPPHWGIRNPDNDITWERNETIGYTHPGSAWINNFENATFDKIDDLITPTYTYSNVDSIFLHFNIAAAIYSDPNSFVPMDTLTILLSRDCGNTFIPVYKKWGTELQTISAPMVEPFYPAGASQWRRDSVNLGTWLGESEQQFSLYFRFAGNFENNLFLDDVTLFTKVVPQRLKEEGLLILPTVNQGQFGIWHYQKPTGLRYISIHNASGQLVWKKDFNHNANTYIPVDLSRLAAGIYFVNLGYDDTGRNVTQRIIKR